MPIASRSRRIVALLAIALSASIVLPAAAEATVAFNGNIYDPEVWVSPNEDGTEARHVGNGWVGQVSPDGELVAYEHAEAFTGWKLMIYNVVTGKTQVRLTHMDTTAENIVGERTAFAWSPDSTMVAALQNDRGSEQQTLYVIGVQGGKSKTRIASGQFRGVSFSPDGKEVVFGLAHTEGALPKTDIARASVSGGPITLLTHDHISGWPLWGPRGQIAFSKRSKAKRSRGEIWTSETFDLELRELRQELRGARRSQERLGAAAQPAGRRIRSRGRRSRLPRHLLVRGRTDRARLLRQRPVRLSGHGFGPDHRR
jgi:hypothetical protein